ncbi:hypothetical protein SBRY_100049 [Actinacidiphila bryophytorum]|uniref:Uncharacterized protein n=1 Tax=Actinacidiphila bryophytorum TaxID=1436133 RepID=A0A9W4GZF6_9ACTN|nr:hypothetical protein SBRY_100049 [Actinacidiphila bryophytorum]
MDPGQRAGHQPGLERDSHHQRLRRVRAQRVLQRLAATVRVDHLRLPRHRDARGRVTELHQSLIRALPGGGRPLQSAREGGPRPTHLCRTS